MVIRMEEEAKNAIMNDVLLSKKGDTSESGRIQTSNMTGNTNTGEITVSFDTMLQNSSRNR